MLLEYMPGKTLMHLLDIRTKIGFFIGLIIISFLFTSPLYNLFLLGVVLSIAYFVRLPIKKIYPLFLGLLPVGVMIILITSVTNHTDKFYYKENQTVLIQFFSGSTFVMSIGGLKMGFTLVIRLLTMVLASTILTITTPVEDFEGLANKLRIPPEIAFVMTTAIGFIPTLDKKRKLIIEAQQARGAQLYKQGLINRIKGYLPIIIPMVTNSIVVSNTLAMSMLSRGYGSSKQISYNRELSLKLIDYISLIVLLILLITSFYLRLVLKYGVL